jgi:hypothetical protein
MAKQRICCIDFDGTIVEHQFPKVGKLVPHCTEVIQKLIDQGWQVVIWTMRSDKFLDDAKVLLNGLFPGNDFMYNKSALQNWTTSPKVYGEFYVDDAAIGCPLIEVENERPYVDWKQVEQHLLAKGFLKHGNA